VCYGFLYQPLTTPCGHSFCRICLLRALDHRDVCPLCRASLKHYLSIHQYNTTTSLDTLVSTYFTEGYKERSLIAKGEQEEFDRVLPIFVCTLALPGIPCPLHIFEPRYRLMVRRCLESGKGTFGMCIYSALPPEEDEDDEGGGNTQTQGGQNFGGYYKYGTTLKINQFKLLEDGRSLLQTVGTRRFKVVERSIREGYNVAKVKYLEDDPIPEDQQETINNLHNTIKQKIHNWASSFRIPPEFREYFLRLGEEPTDTEMFSWWALAALPLNDDIKASLLPEPNLVVRLQKIYRLCAALEENLPCVVM